MTIYVTARLRFLSIFLCVFSLLMQGPIFGLADAVQDTPSKTEQEEENSAEIALQNMLNAFLAKSDDQNEADLKEFLTILFRENQQKFIRAREKNLQLLPSDYRDVLLETEKLYEDIIGSMNITAVIGAHCENALQYIIRNPGLPSLEGEAKKKLLNLLAACHQSLMNGSFMMLLQGADDAILKPGGPEQMANLTAQAQQMLQGMMMPILYLSRDDLKAMLDMLIVLEEQLCTQEAPDLAFCNELKTFRTFLQATYEKNSNRLSELMLDLVNEEFEAMHGKIKGMVTFLEQKSLECDGSGDVELRNACEFFLKIFKRYTNALAAFERIKNNADVTVTNDRYTIFKMITYGYYVGHGFYDLCMEGKKVDRTSKLYIADWIFSGALSGWMFFNQRTDLMNTQLFTRLIGAQPLIKPLDHHMLLQLNIMAAAQALPILFNPKAYVRRPGRFVRVLEKIGTAWFYYHIVERYMNDEKVDLLDWPNKDKHMRRAIVYAIYQGKDYLSDFAESAVKKSIKTKNIAIAYDYSMGVLKPEIVNLVASSLLDFLLLETVAKNNVPWVNNVAEIKSIDIFQNTFEYSFGKNLENYYSDEENKQLWLGTHPTDNLFKLYFQQKLLSYTATSVGGFWGRKAFHRYEKAIGSTLSMGADVLFEILEAFWLISPDTLDDYYDSKKELSAEFEDTLNEIKAILLECFDINSPMRESIIAQLKLRGYVESDTVDPIEQNRSLLYFAINHLVNPIPGTTSLKMLTMHEALKILRTFERDPEDIALVIDNIMNAIRANLAGMCGEWIGGVVTEAVATNYFWSRGGLPEGQKGPWYARLADAVGIKKVTGWFA